MKNLLVIPVLTAALMGVGACGSPDVGIICQVSGSSADGGIGSSSTFLNSQSLDCRSRLCILYRSADKAMCTRICQSNDDCPGQGEVPTCEPGFQCVVGTTSGSLRCCKMCVCAKWTSAFVDGGGGSTTGCEGVTPNCPSL
jgi:hypothetical protein